LNPIPTERQKRQRLTKFKVGDWRTGEAPRSVVGHADFELPRPTQKEGFLNFTKCSSK